MFGIRRKTRLSTQPAAARVKSLFEHPAEFVQHHARTHGVAQRHKLMLASALANPPSLTNALPTKTPRRSLQSMAAANPLLADARPTLDAASATPIAAPESAAGDAPWDLSSRA